MSITSDANSTFLEVDNAHLRVSGDIHATSVKVGAIEILPGYSLESTTVIGNTTSQTIQFTNTETSLVTSGDINMLHSSNNAAIKLNSNVVTEFPRSKKLIKYPRVALTSASQDGYVVSASNVSVNGDGYAAYRVFDNILPDGTTTVGWRTDVGYDSATGLASGITTRFTGDSGEWVEIQLPNSLNLSSINLKPGNEVNLVSSSTRFPKVFVIYGYNGNAWVRVEEFTTSPIQSFTDVQTFHISNPVGEFSKFVLVVKQTYSVTGAPSSVVNIGEIEYFGLPEYDPDAAGMDVKVTSYPNVPNTDWLEVYYDAKDLADGTTTVNDLKPSGTANNGVANGNLSVSDGAFTFDGSGDYISTSITTTITVHTASMWIQYDSPSAWECVYSIGPSSGLDRNNFNLYTNNTYFRLESVGNTGPYFDFIYDFEIGKWVHLTLVFRGTGLEDCEMYINNERLLPRNSSRNSSDDITITGTNNVYIGNDILNAYYHDGKIANFRLFNRALTSDEIWQLYAYQKEYFGHGDLGMTLKAGRLGIGTSEPRAALDVRGDIHGGCPAYFSGHLTSNYGGIGIVPWDTIHIIKGCTLDTSTGQLTIGIKGKYRVYYTARQSGSDTTSIYLRTRVNGTELGTGYGAIYLNTTRDQAGTTIILDLDVNDVIDIYSPGSAGSIASNYNAFTVEYLSSI